MKRFFDAGDEISRRDSTSPSSTPRSPPRDCRAWRRTRSATPIATDFTAYLMSAHAAQERMLAGDIVLIGSMSAHSLGPDSTVYAGHEGGDRRLCRGASHANSAPKGIKVAAGRAGQDRGRLPVPRYPARRAGREDQPGKDAARRGHRRRGPFPPHPAEFAQSSSSSSWCRGSRTNDAAALQHSGVRSISDKEKIGLAARVNASHRLIVTQTGLA